MSSDSETLIAQFEYWAIQTLMSPDTLNGALVVGVCGITAWLVAARGSPSLLKAESGWFGPRARRAMPSLLFPGVWLALATAGLLALEVAGLPGSPFISICINLLCAWLVIRLVAVSVATSRWVHLFAVLVWCYAALRVTGVDEPLASLLESASVSLGQTEITALGVIEGLVALTILLWIGAVASLAVERWIDKAEELTPSVRVLVSKLFRIALFAGAFFVALGVVGVDLTALAVLGGAVGVGLGFGLQKIFANLISGIILLLDKSIKPGDVIAFAGYYGRVDSLGARYVSVATRDGIEHLVPNEDLITSPVENWSYSQDLLRLRIGVGVHYKSDIHLAKDLCLQAAAAIPRILSDPAPNCLLRGFGDSSVDLEVRFWINDPMNGRANVTSDLLFAIWDAFRANGVEIPYPQRDLHLRSSVLQDTAGAFETPKGG